MSRLNLTNIHKMKAKCNKIAMLTAYDASFSYMLEKAGVEIILVGDSLGMVIQGKENTLSVTMEDIIYHTRNVVRGSQNAFIIADMPFMSFANVEQAITNATRIIAEGGAQMIKLESGSIAVDIVKQLSERGIPVCAHLGLLPQFVHRLGGYRVQGRDEEHAKQIIEDANTMQAVGADMLVLECVPAHLGERVTSSVDIPVIGIGAGNKCDGQVLVLYDMLGIKLGRSPKFSHDFLADVGTIAEAIANYVHDVKLGKFPSINQQY